MDAVLLLAAISKSRERGAGYLGLAASSHFGPPILAQQAVFCFAVRYLGLCMCLCLFLS